MKRIAMTVSGIILLLGCATMGASLLLSAVLPNIFEVSLTGVPANYSHEMFYPDLTGPYVFAAAEIIVGAAGMLCLGLKARD